jgi:hypothetical protein
MNVKRKTLCLPLLSTALAVLLSGCLDGALSPHQGDRGYACESHEACLEPLLCLNVPDVSYPVCTGSALQGEGCAGDTACAWVRDLRGLPLTCVDDRCQFPDDGGSP